MRKLLAATLRRIYLPSILEAVPLERQAVLFYRLARAWGICRRYLAVKPGDDTPCIGISWLWAIDDTHPFYECALAHDAAYDALEPGESTLEIDRALFFCMENVCQHLDLYLKSREH